MPSTPGSGWCTSTSGSSGRSPWPRTSCSASTARAREARFDRPSRDRGPCRASSGAATASRSTRARGSSHLSVGEQQRVEILKALYRDARVLILDEPTAVLTPQEAEVLFVTLRQMAADGRTVIFISHKLNEVMAVSDRVTVLRGGRSVGDRGDVGLHAPLARGADGRPRAGRLHAFAAARPGDPMLEVEELRAEGVGARRSEASRSPSARARSSPSPGSRATASASSPRRSRGCAAPPEARSGWAASP